MSSLINLTQIFPQLKDKKDHYFSQQQIQAMPYFKQLSLLLPQKDFSQQIKKAKRHFKLLNIKKGTIIYTNSSQSNCSYFSCHGCVKLLIKKNNRQKLQSHHKHVLHLVQERVKFLNEQLGIPMSKCELLMSEFYQQKVLFKYLEYQQIYGQGYFGISDLVRSINRPFMAIATQDTILLQIQRSHFDSTLRQLQIRKQEIILKSLLENFNSTSSQSSASTFPSISQQLGVKLSQVFSQFVLRSFEKDQKIYKENQPCQLMYFIIKGEVQLSKTFALEIPKKMIKEENKHKPQIGKQIEVKVSRLAQKCYLGQVQHFLHSRQREFTATSISNNTIALQIQPYVFMKIVFEFTTVQRDLTISAKQKLSIASENYFKQKSKVTKLFLQQFQNIENKKKQKILSNLLSNDEDGHQNNLLAQASSSMFQVFSKQGVFFRDTYERLEGFQEYQQTQANNKRAAIRKYKLQTSYIKRNADEKDYGHEFSKFPSSSISKQMVDNFQAFNSKQKLLNSPKKNLSIFELMGGATMTPQIDKNRRLSFSSQQGSSIHIKSKSKIKQFNHLQKDEAVFKRVLIKNGRYQQDKSTYKQHIVKPIVHPKFDDIVKQCMGRKNQVIRKAIGENRTDLVKDTFQNVVGELKNKSLSISKFSSNAYETTCKGTQEFKKKLQMFSRHNRKTDYHSAIRNRVALQQETLKACIGFNEAPKSSYQKNRSQMIMKETDNASQNFMNTQKMQCTIYSGFGKRASSHTDLSNRGRKSVTNGFNGKRNSPQKLILLNHMMKPIIYSSVQY